MIRQAMCESTQTESYFVALQVRSLVAEATGTRPVGKIFLLTNLAYWGYCFNPASFYYILDSTNARIETIIAEVTNTPW